MFYHFPFGVNIVFKTHKPFNICCSLNILNGRNFLTGYDILPINITYSTEPKNETAKFRLNQSISLVENVCVVLKEEEIAHFAHPSNYIVILN